MPLSPFPSEHKNSRSDWQATAVAEDSPMFGTFGRHLVVLAVVALIYAAPATGQPVSFTGNTYSENFNSMGSGTTPPAGWGVLTIAGASDTWTNLTGNNNTPPNPASSTGGIPNGTAVAGGTAGSGLLVTDNPTANNVNGYNAIGSSGAANDRAIATAPTGVAGNVLELSLTNNSGTARTAMTLSYDIVRKTQAADSGRTPPPGIPEGSDELPGYWFFFSLDNGANFTAVRPLIPVGESPSNPAGQPFVPNTVGLTTIPATTFSLGGSWNVGSNLILRWIDDNAIDPSPDQIYALDNVFFSVTPVPEPSSLICLSVVGLIAGAREIRRRQRS
jgi:hypothetical protein